MQETRKTIKMQKHECLVLVFLFSIQQLKMEIYL